MCGVKGGSEVGWLGNEVGGDETSWRPSSIQEMRYVGHGPARDALVGTRVQVALSRASHAVSLTHRFCSGAAG